MTFLSMLTTAKVTKTSIKVIYQQCLKINAVLWSDGCAAQFRSRFVFKLMAGIESSIYVVLQRAVSRERRNGWDWMNCVIKTPKQFAEHTEKPIRGIKSLYLPTDGVLVEPDDRDASTKIP